MKGCFGLADANALVMTGVGVRCGGTRDVTWLPVVRAVPERPLRVLPRRQCRRGSEQGNNRFRRLAPPSCKG